MERPNGYPRPPGPPGPGPPGPGPPGPGPPGPRGQQKGPPPGWSPSEGRPRAPMTRAQRFEDEKRRLIESCFSKLNNMGAPVESYITHVRVEEDGQYPQSPPAPDSLPSNKKARIIVVGVKDSGRVRLHKTRENANGSFSIGKTWPLEEFTKVESFSSSNPTDPEGIQRKQWAGDRGFIVTIGKPYYWAAGTAKEKEFFIASLVKIYKKYTEGKIPELVGFTPQEAEQLKGPPLRPPGQPGPHPPPGPQPQGHPSPPYKNPLQSPPMQGGLRAVPPQRDPSQDSSQYPPSSAGAGSRAGHRRSPSSQRDGPTPGLSPRPREPSREPRPPPSRDGGLRKYASQEPVMGRNQTPSSSRLTPESSRSELTSHRSTTPEPLDIPPALLPRQSPRNQRSYQNAREAFTGNQRPGEGLGISSSPDRPRATPPVPRDRTGSRPSTASTMDKPFREPFRDEPPERKRPPLRNREGSETRSIAPDERVAESPAPLFSSNRRQGIQLPASSSDSKLLKGQMEKPPGSSDPSLGESARSEPSLEETKSQDSSQNKGPSPEKVVSPKPVISPEPKPVVSPPSDQEERPGLGQMVKKKSGKDVANAFRKAATTYGAFKPRAGGALDKLKAAQSKSNEPDGINAVVPAPPKPKQNDESVSPKAARKPSGDLSTKAAVPTDSVPQLTVSSPMSRRQAIVDQNAESSLSKRNAEKLNANVVEIEAARKQRRRSQYQTKCLSKLGVDASIFEGRGIDFETALDDFGWGTSMFQRPKIEVFEVDVRRALGRLEAGSLLGDFESNRDRVDVVETLFDRALAECDEFEGLLTLYGVELSSLNEDIAYIEAQSQGLQVQTANQKLLQGELQNLLATISVDTQHLKSLKSGSIKNPESLMEIENALALLYKAMITIDPSLRSGSEGNGLGSGRDELSNMRALMERKDTYLSQCTLFIARLKQHMDITFGAALMATEDAINTAKGYKNATRLDPALHDVGRTDLWKYSPLMLFVKEIDYTSWEGLLRVYHTRARKTYHDECRENLEAWKKSTRKPTGDEADLLFTSQEKENEGLSSTARKLTVKRSQTLARTLRAGGGEKQSPTERSQSGSLHAFESFAGFLDQVAPLVFTEQNFVVDFFHASSSERLDYAEAIAVAPPDERRGTNLHSRKVFEPDRAMAKRVTIVMEEIFSFWPNDLQRLVDWAVSQDPLQGIGVLCAIERKMLELEETNQDFLIKTLQKNHDKLTGQFAKFVEDQIRAIEDTKVKIKKRKGVIAFIKIFPVFSSAIENMLPSYDDRERLDARTMVDEAYQKLNKAMFDSLRIIAKESPGAAVGQGVHNQGIGDPEDKEALNYHILLIENMNHYVEEVDVKRSAVLSEWGERAEREMEEHLTLYLDAVIRRPLGKVLDFLESTESLLSTLSTPPTSIATRSSHSQHVFRKLLAAYDNKELRRGVDVLKKRVEKHFGDADEPGLSRPLVDKVLKACLGRYVDTVERVEKVRRDVYEGDMEEQFWKVDEVTAAFRR
ncbi:hypothetical protein P152DRAFT_462769 [Eremomyces bilateralis CBS 781.70]|uniref:Exocyst complex component Sec3 PIP2-binding N-terminal domain-containing protein n=1 Tax=Eremomyces bilateralis CBS 781.70 TaxID=1392243 RepID=A0A6G1FQX4_9PEZI|nr:uncharacterized protein P152DRAFT_462769 [Eremomyces bilateralis CBS 781.70]KAF1808194.1 hypothetical protein P152DRAFT_462769 [Eremomyces bilateralis CBS 781.70]